MPQSRRYEFPATVTAPFDKKAEAEFDWYFEEHLRFPFTVQVRARNAGAIVTVYGEALFRQLIGSNEARESYGRLKNRAYPDKRALAVMAPAFQAFLKGRAGGQTLVLLGSRSEEAWLAPGEVLVVRVHPEMLDRQHLPRGRIGKHIWDDRLEAIAAHEKYLAQQGTVILKFFLHISREEQKRRFLRRLDEPAKNWKFEPADLAERQFWDAYMEAYEQAIRATAAPHAPWYVVPADQKWFARLVVVTALVNALDELDLDFPKLGEDAESSLALARASLEDEARHVKT